MSEVEGIVQREVDIVNFWQSSVTADTEGWPKLIAQ
jgi:hypothetical protein